MKQEITKKNQPSSDEQNFTQTTETTFACKRVPYFWQKNSDRKCDTNFLSLVSFKNLTLCLPPLGEERNT